MSSGFISESEILEARRRRQEEWEKVRTEDQPKGVKYSLVTVSISCPFPMIITIKHDDYRNIRSVYITKTLNGYLCIFSAYQYVQINLCWRTWWKILADKHDIDLFVWLVVALNSSPLIPLRLQVQTLSQILSLTKHYVSSFSEAPEEQYDTRPLFQRLEEQRLKKEAEYEEAHKLSK